MVYPLEDPMSYAIEKFWVPRLDGVARPSTVATLAGWSSDAKPNPSFVEADLHVRDGFDDLTGPIWFVAAPGAVGKSTLAKEISARTGAVYLDLAKAETVAGNYLTGGLVKNGLLTAWQENRTTLLIDALDEARLRVTQSSFEDFLNDVEHLSRGRRMPTVFFGRVGIVEDAWLVLSESGMNCSIFDIDFFDTRRSTLFIMAALDRLAQMPKYHALTTSLGHRPMYEKAAASFVKGLEAAAPSDGARFAGYAPVLEAVATALAEVTNPASLNDSVQKAMQGQVLQQLTNQILNRESGKLRAQLPAAIPNAVKEGLFSPDEQLIRLGGLVYQTPVALPRAELLAEFVGAYDAAVNEMMPNHPFLDGTGRKPSGAVFAAAINADALFSKSAAVVAAAEQHAGNGPHTPNPFLIDFYLDTAGRKRGEDFVVPPEHVVALYESVRARASATEVVRLTIEGEDDSDEADVEIQISGTGARASERRMQLRTSQAGELRFGRQVNGVTVDAPQLDVIIGSGNPVEMVTPVSLSIGTLAFNCPELVVQRGDHGAESEDTAVILEARGLSKNGLTSAPLVRKGAELSVLWPGASAYPWTNFVSVEDESQGNGDSQEKLRGFRRLVLAFRSHGKGRLARFRDKIEHIRITKGAIGVAIRERLMRDGILSIEHDMYFLNPSVLGKVVGATYQDLKLKRFNDQVRQYVAAIHI